MMKKEIVIKTMMKANDLFYKGSSRNSQKTELGSRCHSSYMVGLLRFFPLYLKTYYGDEPLFSDSKIYKFNL